jgi:cytochrome P450
MCIGNNLAIMESVLAIATIAQQFELKVVKDQIIEAELKIVFRPKYGKKARLRRLTL